ncbi:MAG TPA: cell division protein ZipA C-terminal FtsZ-binding domain-containing protein [Bordetella sp.]|uniref:cell division protein ZipA C-terminal FtsZ-binding domain-containing protein n=1 Tax=Bordetella sp. TaxID=28081 RepID=UPI002ED200FE
MSELQIGLIALGVLFILLVLGFNWWQDHRVRRRMQVHFPGSDQDPLLGDDKPRAQGAAAPAPSVMAVRREPGMGSGSSEASAAALAETDDLQEPDPACEVVIDVRFGGPVRGADLQAALIGFTKAGRKPVRVFAETDTQHHRARLHPEESYVSVQLAVLLANRSGPLTAIEWSQAWSRAEDLSERFEGTLEGPDQQVVLEQAAKLDDACAALDTQVGLTLSMPAPQPMVQIIGVAQGLGFVADGIRLAWLSSHNQVCFTLLRADGAAMETGTGATDRLYLLLDVPCSPADPRAFGRMVDVGRDLATRLGADLVDDHGKPLAAGAEASIDERLQVLFQQLDQAGLTAGGERALRVFA